MQVPRIAVRYNSGHSFELRAGIKVGKGLPTGLQVRKSLLVHDDALRRYERGRRVLQFAARQSGVVFVHGNDPFFF